MRGVAFPVKDHRFKNELSSPVTTSYRFGARAAHLNLCFDESSLTLRTILLSKVKSTFLALLVGLHVILIFFFF